jgi:hypothetical protein
MQPWRCAGVFGSGDAWKPALIALEQQLRSEIRSTIAPTPVALAGRPMTPPSPCRAVAA